VYLGSTARLDYSLQNPSSRHQKFCRETDSTGALMVFPSLTDSRLSNMYPRRLRVLFCVALSVLLPESLCLSIPGGSRTTMVLNSRRAASATVQELCFLPPGPTMTLIQRHVPLKRSVLQRLFEIAFVADSKSLVFEHAAHGRHIVMCMLHHRCDDVLFDQSKISISSNSPPVAFRILKFFTQPDGHDAMFFLLRQ
jgi:hypothetical protein